MQSAPKVMSCLNERTLMFWLQRKLLPSTFEISFGQESYLESKGEKRLQIKGKMWGVFKND